MKLFRKVISFPFALIGAVSLGIALALSFGLDKAENMVDGFIDVVNNNK